MLRCFQGQVEKEKELHVDVFADIPLPTEKPQIEPKKYDDNIVDGDAMQEEEDDAPLGMLSLIQYNPQT